MKHLVDRVKSAIANLGSDATYREQIGVALDATYTNYLKAAIICPPTLEILGRSLQIFRYAI